MPPDDLRKLLRVRAGQIRRTATAMTADGLEEQTIHVERVSRSDVHQGAERLKMQPGVQSVETSRSGRWSKDAQAT